MAIPKSLTETFHSNASEGQLTADDIQRLTAEASSQRIRADENDELLSHNSIAGRTLRGDQWARYNDELRTRTDVNGKKDGIDVLLMHLLDEIQRLNDELAGLRLDMAKMEAEFEAEFGSEWHDAMADMYLSDDEKDAFAHLSGDERDEAILQALKDKMLNPDGSIKDEYKDTPIAVYVHKHEQEKVRTAQVLKLETSIEKNDPDLARSELREVAEFDKKGVVSETFESKTGAGLSGQFEDAVKTDAGAALIEEYDAVDVDVDENSNDSMAFLNELNGFG